MEAEGSKLTKQITSLKPGTAYYFQMQAKTIKGWGPLSDKEEVSTLTGIIFVIFIFSKRQDVSFVSQEHLPSQP